MDGLTIQWLKDKRTNNDLQNTAHKGNDTTAKTPIKTGS